MMFEPRPYQSRGMAFIHAHKRCALHMDIGTGKTATTATACLDLMEDCAVRGVLVFAPLMVATISWPEEFAKWDHLRDVRHIVVRGTAAERIRLLRTPAAFYLINYDLMSWWVEWVAGECKAQRPLLQDMLVLDESSRLKAHDSGRFKDLKPLADSSLFPRIVTLTGTPAPESYRDLWSQYRLLDHGVALGPYWTHFLQRYYVQNPYNRYEVTMAPGADVAIQRRIAPMTVTVRAEDYLSLPPLMENIIYVDLPSEARTHYVAFEKEMLAAIDGENIAAAGSPQVSEKCRQVCSGAVYNEKHETLRLHTVKFDALDEILADPPGTIMVAFWYRHELETIRRRYPTARILGPNGSAQDALRTVRDWNARKIPLLFVHPASVGHGINLQEGGNNLVWLTSPWSNELDQQLTGRLHRSGQTRPVMVHRIVCRRTVDMVVVSGVKGKQFTQAGLRSALAAIHNPL